eukprot:CAMPEP_0169192138 /NCGR_PEP_ID=MMETSP1016-20121227/5446_1 /TAXON_ID=342587 /ORGANISM="Karlodinium micrum, Strain CCMP2283" /LENGTH=111 /DNA_ID=CAMNT_0009268441 /DNA_START=519 /DNA_END=854 /DNA_ORIENTATION=-
MSIQMTVLSSSSCGVSCMPCSGGAGVVAVDTMSWGKPKITCILGSTCVTTLACKGSSLVADRKEVFNVSTKNNASTPTGSIETPSNQSITTSESVWNNLLLALPELVFMID